jgi:hypothetical protein
MLVKIHTAAKSILNLPRFAKQIIVIIVDLSLCVLCTWFAFYLRLDQFISIKGTSFNGCRWYPLLWHCLSFGYLDYIGLFLGIQV